MASLAPAMVSRAAIGVQQMRSPKAAPVRRIGGLPAEITTSSDIDSDEDDEDSSDDDTEDDDEADVAALSVARIDCGNAAQKRLAGPANEAMCVEHDAQASAGASEDSEDDEDAYAGVEDISDDEASIEGDKKKKNIRLAAEQDLRAEFEGLEQEKTADAMTTGMDDMFLQDDDPFSQRHNMYSNGNLLDRLHDPLDLNLDPYCGLPMDSTVYQEMSNEAEELFMERRGSDDSINGRKKVRFIVPQPDATLSRSSSISSNEEEQDPNELFPDLFDTQDGMANAGLSVEMFQHEFNDLESCYDFEGDDTLALDDDEESDSEADDESDFDDSEEGGDTTDEEDEEEHIARMQERRKAAGRSPLLAPTTPKPKITPTRVKMATPASTPRTGKGPRIGTFAIDKTRATMSVDAGNKMKILPPTKPTEKDRAFWARMRSANSSRSSTPRSSVSYSVHTPGPSSSVTPRPLTAQSTLATMFDGNLDVLNDADPTGLDELFGLSPRAQTSFTQAMATADSDEEMGEQLNIRDFIQIDDSDDDSDGAEDSALTSPIHSEVFDPFRPTSSHGVSGGLLDHLEQQRGLVGSFRRNQNFAKHVSSLPSNPNRRAALSEFNALQKGRRSAGNTPITPARKNRHSQELTGAGVRKATASPLTARRPRSRGNSLSSAALQQTLGPDLEMRQ